MFGDAKKRDTIPVLSHFETNNIVDYIEGEGEGEIGMLVNVKDLAPNLYGLYL